MQTLESKLKLSDESASELTPWTGAPIRELISQAGFPKDLVQVLQGGGDLGAAIIEAGPNKVAFTGSVATGRQIAEACGRKLIPSVLELGGKDAFVYLLFARRATRRLSALLSPHGARRLIFRRDKI